MPNDDLIDPASLVSGIDPYSKNASSEPIAVSSALNTKRTGASGSWAEEPEKTLPDYRNDIAAAVYNGSMGLTNQLLGGIPYVGPAVRGADAAAMMTGVAAPLIKRGLGDEAGAVAEKIGSFSPSQIVANELTKLVGGDPSKGSSAAQTLGVIAGINPLGIAKKGIEQGGKAVLNETGKSAAVGAGAVYGGSVTGNLISDIADSVMDTPLSDKERESVQGLTAPLAGAGAGKLYAGAGTASGAGGKTVDRIKELTAGGQAESRIKQIEAESPPERTMDELKVAKKLQEKGLSAEEAIAETKKASQGVYGDVAKSKTREIDHRIVDAVKDTISTALGDQSYLENNKQAIGIVNTAVKSFEGIKSLLDNPISDAEAIKSQADLESVKKAENEKLATTEDRLQTDIGETKKVLTNDLEATKKQAEAAIFNNTSALQDQIRRVIPSYEFVKSDPNFQKWVRGKDTEALPENKKQGLVAKYFIKDAIDKYYDKHVEPIKSELMNMDSGLKGFEDDFAQYVADNAAQIADPGNPAIVQSMYRTVKSFADTGRLDTVQGVYDLLNHIEKNSNFKDDPTSKKDMKAAIISILPSEVQTKIGEFKQAYAPFGSEFKRDTPMYKLSVYDPDSSITGTSMAKLLSDNASAEKTNSILTLAKDTPEIGYTAVHGLNVMMGEAFAKKGYEGIADVIKEHIASADALAQVLPDGHPAKSALLALPGLLSVVRNAETIERAVAEKESKVKDILKQQEVIAKNIMNVENERAKAAISEQTKLTKQIESEYQRLSEQRKATEQDVQKYIDDLAHYGRFAADSYTNLLAVISKDPGMLNQLKTQAIGKEVPLTHEVAKSLLIDGGVNPDLTKPRAILKALSALEGTDNVIPDLIRQGVGSEIAKFHEDGSLDHPAVLQAMKAKAPVIQSYIKNLHALLDTTPGLAPSQVVKSKRYLDNVSDAIDVTNNDLVSKVFQRVYSPSEHVNTQGDLKSKYGVDTNRLLYPGIGSGFWRVWSAANSMASQFFHGKDAIDTAILKKLDDHNFVQQVSRLKKEYMTQRAEDVRRQANEEFKKEIPDANTGLLSTFKNILNAVFPGSQVSTGFLDRVKQIPKNYLNAFQNSMSYQAERQQLNNRFQQNFNHPINSPQQDELDEDTKAIMNWKP